MDVMQRVTDGFYDVPAIPGLTCERRSEAYVKARRKYDALCVAKKEAFRRNLEDEFGVIGNPKADQLFAKAYERGHSGGFREVYHEYADLVELISEHS